MCWIMPIRLPVSFSGSIINSADLEHAGYAEVDGFYRFPSFELCEGERCQQGYSASNVKRNHRRRIALPTSFATEIRPLFRASDVDVMQGYGLDLSSYEEVKTRASEIYARLEDGSMPCDEPWSPERLGLFK